MYEELKDVAVAPICGDRELLLCVTCQREGLRPSDWLAEHEKLLEPLLDRYGGLLLRGFEIHSMTEFNRVLSHVSSDLLEYMFRSTPRTLLGGRIYTASEYPANRHIALHNEFSYFHSWPTRITFYCTIAPTTGGETPVASSARIYEQIPPEVRARFEAKGVMYIRNYSSGLDLNWREVFQSDNPRDVEKYCDENEVRYEWLEGDRLRTSHVAQATIAHRSAKKLWFNQAHLFHFSSLDPATREILTSYVKDEDLPRNSKYGDGTAIAEEDLALISEAYEREMIRFSWQRGDIMILDNTLMAHGRTPYTGDRKVAVGMG